jgi:hypothetical protein
MRAREGGEVAWPADHVERWPIDRLIPYAKNSRTHSEAQIAQLAASMKEWGWTNPVLADEAGGVIAGHARILTARQLGYEEVPVMVGRGWSDAQKRAYVIADNQLALNAGWDKELLGLELGELKLGGFDLALTGFGELELGDLLADGGHDRRPNCARPAARSHVRCIQAASGKPCAEFPQREQWQWNNRSAALQQGRECHGPRIAGQACDRDRR